MSFDDAFDNYKTEVFPKDNTHRDGHTHRFKQKEYFDSKNYLLKTERSYSRDHISLSDIDDFFPNNLVLLNGNDKERPLNTSEQWSNIEKALEEKSVKTSKKWDPYDGVVTKTYDVPVSKYLLKENLASMELSWLKWNNNYYDPQYIYTFVGDDDDTKGTLKNYCPCIWADPEIPGYQTIITKTFNEVKPTKKVLQTKSNHWEIDLGSVQNITHMATWGKYPILRPFPIYRKSFYYDRSNSNKTYVKVLLNNRDESYVKKYSVSYKDVATQKWIGYKDFEGNINPHTPKTNSLNIISRYLRIKPLDFVGSRSMIISLYGEILPEKKTNKKNKAKTDDDSDDEEIIKYTLIPPNSSEKRNDGYGERCISPEYYYGQYYKTERKKRMKKLMKQQIDSLYNNFELHSDSEDE